MRMPKPSPAKFSLSPAVVPQSSRPAAADSCSPDCPARSSTVADPAEIQGTDVEADSQRQTRPRRVRGAPSRYTDYYVPNSFAGVVSSPGATGQASDPSSLPHIPEDPDTYTEAMRSPQASEWQAAMQIEYDSLISSGTWRLVQLPLGRKAVKCKWIYRVKTNPDGSVSKYKARLVAQGCTQTKGVDYDQTFSPVVKYDAIRAVLSIAAQQGMHMTQFDIQTAFLNGLIDTVLYMQ